MATQQQRGSGFIGLDKYLAANRKAASDMAGRLGDTVDSSGQEAANAFPGYVETFKRDVAAGMPQINEDAPLTSADAQQYAGATYGGPNALSDLAGWDASRSKADKAAQDASALTSLYGRQTMLQDMYGKQGNYNLGQQRLDSFLSGAAGGQRFDELKAKYGALSEAYGDANRASQGQAKAASDDVAATAKKYGGMVDSLKAQEQAAADAAAKAEQERKARERLEIQRQQAEMNRSKKSKPAGRFDWTEMEVP